MMVKYAIYFVTLKSGLYLLNSFQCCIQHCIDDCDGWKNNRSNSTSSPHRALRPTVRLSIQPKVLFTAHLKHRLVGVRNRNVVAPFWVGKEVMWVYQQWGDEAVRENSADLYFCCSNSTTMGQNIIGYFSIGVLLNCSWNESLVLTM